VQKRAYLSLGSNLGDRIHHLEEAIRLLAGPNIAVVRRSSFYETEPRDFTRQPWFVNLVIEIETRLFPRQLLAEVQRVENQMGRKRPMDKGPRTIDIDIVLFGKVSINTSGLVVPHPRFHERRFVLEPLAELDPGLRHPVTGETVSQLLVQVGSQRVIKVQQVTRK